MSLEERLDHLEAAFEEKINEEENFIPPKRCALCVKVNKEKMVMENEILCSYPSKEKYKIGDWRIYYAYVGWFIASTLVREWLKRVGVTKCNHEVMAEGSLEIIKHIENFMRARVDDYYHPTQLINVLQQCFDKNEGPNSLMKILGIVGKDWLDSLKPEDFDLGCLKILEQHGTRTWNFCYVPPFHKNLWLDRKGWAETCDCADCQSYYTEKKEALEKTFADLNYGDMYN